MAKKLLSLFLCFALFLCGCSAQNAGPGADTNISSSSVQEGELEIFCLESANIFYGMIAFREQFPDIRLSVQKFKTSSEMEDVLINRINTKDAPDIVIFDYSTTLDFEKLAQKEAFYPLTDFIKEDGDFTLENYLPAAVNRVQTDEEPYFLPFSLMPVINYSPQSLMETLQIEQGTTTLEEYFLALQNHDQQNAQDAYTLSFFRQSQLFGEENIPIVPLVLGVADIDIAQELHSPDFKERLKLVVDFSILIELQDQKAQNAYRTNWSAVNWENTFSISQSSCDILRNITMYISAYRPYFKEDVGYFVLPTLRDPQKTSALLSAWGSVLADCENPRAAYDFLRCVMDHYEIHYRNGLSRWSTPVCKEKIYEIVESYQSQSWKLRDNTVVNPITDATAENILKLYHSIESFQFPNPKLADFIDTEFYDYNQGTASYDMCYEKFLNKMRLYQEE